jgi:hypothetical protein
MPRHPIRQLVLWGVVATLLLPVVLAVVLGLGGLLHGLGDAAGGRVCLRLALGVGAAWAVAIVATTVTSALATLAADGRASPPRPRWYGRRPGRRRRRR